MGAVAEVPTAVEAKSHREALEAAVVGLMAMGVATAAEAWVGDAEVATVAEEWAEAMGVVREVEVRSEGVERAVAEKAAAELAEVG